MNYNIVLFLQFRIFEIKIFRNKKMNCSLTLVSFVEDSAETSHTDMGKEEKSICHGWIWPDG